MEEYFQSSDFVLPCENHLKYFFYWWGSLRCWICCIVSSDNKVILLTAHGCRLCSSFVS